MSIDLEKLPPAIQFAYIAITKTAIIFKEMEKDKNFFILFCKEIWDSMELTDVKKLDSILEGKMQKDIKPYVEDYIKKSKGK
jgi:predicted AAA+ superfamily ATPase